MNETTGQHYFACPKCSAEIIMDDEDIGKLQSGYAYVCLNCKAELTKKDFENKSQNKINYY